MERNVFFSVKVRNGLLQLFHHVDVTVDGYRRVIYVYCLFSFFAISSFIVPSRVRISVSFSEYPFQKKFGRDQCKFEHQFLVLLKSQSTEFCDVGVQFFGSLSFPLLHPLAESHCFGRTLRCILASS